jgi:hypothetical protein
VLYSLQLICRISPAGMGRVPFLLRDQPRSRRRDGLVSPYVQLGTNAIALAAGFALTLWGLRIYKAYILLIGVLAGGALGAGLGTMTGDSGNGLLVGGLVGALLGAILAWPLQKLAVFLVAGTVAGFLAVMTLLGVSNAGAPLGAAFLIAFIIGGVLALLVFEYVVTAVMAVIGAQAVFFAVFVSRDAFAGRSVQEVVEGAILAYANGFVAFAASTVLFTAFALWLHRLRRTALPQQQHDGLTSRPALTRLAVHFALMIVGATILTGSQLIGNAWSVGSFELTGMHPLSWPFVSLAGIVFARWLGRSRARADGAGPPPAPRLGSWLAASAFSVTVIPLVSAVTFVTYGGAAGLEAFYAAFISPPASSMACKWLFALGVLPLLLTRSVRGIAAERWAASDQIAPATQTGPPATAVPPAPQPMDA